MLTSQVCNKYKDCLDGSDENVCGDEFNDEDSIANQKKREFGRLAFGPDKSFDYCLAEIQHQHLHPLQANNCITGEMQTICETSCPGYRSHCSRIDWKLFCVYNSFKVSYNCSATENFNNVNKINTGICDGIFDCTNYVDEQNCSNRFYCSDGVTSVRDSQVCDSSPDCPLSSDECQGCLSEGLVTDKDFIGNGFLRWFTVLQCMLILGLNCKAGVEYVKCKKKTKIGKIDRLLCTSLAAFDLLMGVYMLFIAVKTVLYHFIGPYCVHDLGWRSSLGCASAGIIFSIATHGSLLTAMVMSVTRCYTCVRPFADHSFKLTVKVLVVLQTTSIILCIIPVLPFNLIQDLSKATVFFSGNKIVSRANDSQLKEILTAYKGADVKVDSLKRSEVIAALGNMTSDSSMFDVSHYLGFYSSSPLCINIQQYNIPVVKMVYVAVIGAIIGVVSLSYIIIAITTKKTEVPAQGNKEKRIETKERMQFLSFKVTTIIIAQIFCWVPILITSVLSLFDIKTNVFLYEIAAILILPLNSVFNPILYTTLLKKSFMFATSRITSFIHIAIETISSYYREEPSQGADIELPELNTDQIQPENVAI